MKITMQQFRHLIGASTRCAIALTAFSAVLLGCLMPGRSDAAGEVEWFSLLTEDAAAAMAFYTELFGWQIESSPTGAYVALRDGMPIAGISQIEDRLPGVSESMWLAAISVADLPASVRSARELGATIREDITNVPGWGRYALIQDPQGAPALLVRPARRLGDTGGYGGWAWAELWSHDSGAAGAFYAGVIGYEPGEVRIGEQDYAVLRHGDAPRAGLMRLEREEIAARWMPYIGVSDLRGTLVRVWAAGGEVLLEPAEVASEVGGAGRVALIADPGGAFVFLYQLDETASADPNVAARRLTGSDPRARSRDGGANVSVHIAYGFGPGWGLGYPVYPYRPYGLPYPY